MCRQWEYSSRLGNAWDTGQGTTPGAQLLPEGCRGYGVSQTTYMSRASLSSVNSTLDRLMRTADENCRIWLGMQKSWLNGMP